MIRDLAKLVTNRWIYNHQLRKDRNWCTIKFFSGNEDDNVPSADSLNDLDQIEEVDEGLDEVPDNDEENEDDIESDYEPLQSGGIMSRQNSVRLKEVNR